MAKPKTIPVLNERQIQRFWRHVDVRDAGQCWNWLGAVGTIGYGIVRVRGEHYKPHRIAWTLVRGRSPGELTIDHLCGNKLCCNTIHMEPVTQSVNSIRARKLLQP